MTQATKRVALVLHGGGGPMTMTPITQHLGSTMHVLAPTHPGWNGVPRPASIASVADLAQHYVDQLAHDGHRDVLIIGSSVGGWLACEIALRAAPGTIAGIVIINAAGIAVPNEPVRDVFNLSPQELAVYSFHDPAKFAAMAPPQTPELIAMRRANAETLRALAGEPYMHDPTLLGRLHDLHQPALVLWGESDRVVTLAYGRAFAAALPHATFHPIALAGHLPHLEQPAATLAAIDAFAATL